MHNEWFYLNKGERLDLEQAEDAIEERVHELEMLKAQRRQLLNRGRARMYRERWAKQA